MPDLASYPALWGLGGAFMFAAPLLSTCIFTARATGGSFARCGLEFVTALAVGSMAAAAATPVLQEVFHLGSPAWARFISTGVGLLANRIAPMIVDAAPAAVIEWAARMFKRSEK